ncbi:type II secretion system F family protein [Parasphingorhabdus sp.]|uniref:type II secretion system F family protein n=1 Tax=Parasphingorhabdus sp. TaxID=2709688 RepID=UPI0030A1116A|nr:type II secretion system F family protein [Sphingomonadales bacterium]
MTSGGGPTLMGVDVLWVATMLSAVAASAVFFAIYAAVTVRDPMAKRVKALNARREQLKAGITASTTKKRAKLVQQNDTTDRIRNVLSSMQVLQDTQVKQAQKKLAQAGIRSKDLAFLIIFSRLVLPILLGGGAALAIYGFNYLADWSDIKRFGVFAGAAISGYKGADIYLNNLIAKRTDLIRKGLPDALDLLVICAEAGLTVDAAFSRVSRELGSAYPELADEFSLTSIELGFLTERRQAFENLAYRVALGHIKGVVTTMIQTEKYGTPLASSLRVLSAEFRNDRMMRAEEKAARLPAIMTVPLILFILPTLFIVILGPAACSISDAML